MNCNRKTARDGLAAAWLKATQNSSPAAGYIYIHHERSGVCIKTASLAGRSPPRGTGTARPKNEKMGEEVSDIVDEAKIRLFTFTAPSPGGGGAGWGSEPSAARQPHPFPRFPIYIHPERSGVCKNCPLPRWGRVGVGAANHPQRDNFTRSHASLFTYPPLFHEITATTESSSPPRTAPL